MVSRTSDHMVPVLAAPTPRVMARKRGKNFTLNPPRIAPSTPAAEPNETPREQFLADVIDIARQ
jgi:hypothetical protein